MLELGEDHWSAAVALAWREHPLECCALLIGQPGGDRVQRLVPIDNEARSATRYRLDGAQYLRASLDAEEQGLDVIGVLHSHPQTEAYPSPTDRADAANPLIPRSWHWAIVSLRHEPPVLRSFLLTDGGVEEEPVHLVDENRACPETDRGTGRSR